MGWPETWFVVAVCVSFEMCFLSSTAARLESVTEGCTRGDCQSGEGQWEFEDGAIYEGEFAKGLFHGAGKMKYPGGDVYDGFWKKGQRHGKGEHKYPNGHVYDGDWKKDVPHGHGSYTFPTGANYEGDFRNGAFEGFGVYTYADGSEYEGHWREGLREGKGLMRMPQGDKYEGVWKSNEWDPSQGHPVYHRADGFKEVNSCTPHYRDAHAAAHGLEPMRHSFTRTWLCGLIFLFSNTAGTSERVT